MNSEHDHASITCVLGALLLAPSLAMLWCSKDAKEVGLTMRMLRRSRARNLKLMLFEISGLKAKLKALEVSGRSFLVFGRILCRRSGWHSARIANRSKRISRAQW